METGAIIIIGTLVAVIVVLATALINLGSKVESGTSGDKAIKYLRDNCKHSVMFLHEPGFYDDNDLSFASKIESALSQGLGYKRELEYKILELDSLKNTQDKDLRKWCIEHSDCVAGADYIFKYITAGKRDCDE